LPSVTVDPSGRFAYVAHTGSNNVSAFTIDPGTGALTAVSGSPFAAQTAPSSVTVDPAGQFAYVANSSSNDVSVFTIDPGTGALSPRSGTVAGAMPESVTVDPTGKFVYTANPHNGTISAFRINTPIGDGSLTSVLGSPFPVVSSDIPQSVTVDPTGRFAYVGDVLHGHVYAFSINSTGALTAVSGSPFAAGMPGTELSSVTVDPSGNFAYVTDFFYGFVDAFAINTGTGALTAVGSFATGSGSGAPSQSVITRGKIQ
jgi:6-phosphogluconolactonase